MELIFLIAILTAACAFFALLTKKHEKSYYFRCSRCGCGYLIRPGHLFVRSIFVKCEAYPDGTEICERCVAELVDRDYERVKRYRALNRLIETSGPLNYADIVKRTWEDVEGQYRHDFWELSEEVKKHE